MRAAKIGCLLPKASQLYPCGIGGEPVELWNEDYEVEEVSLTIPKKVYSAGIKFLFKQKNPELNNNKCLHFREASRNDYMTNICV